MKSKSFTLLLFSIILSLLMSSCSPAQVTDIPTKQPATETPKPAATKTKISTPTLPVPSTETASPRPEIQLNGLLPELKDFPVYTAEQEQAAIQKAIETVSVQKPSNENSRIQISQFVYNDIIFGKGVKVISNPSTAFLYRDSYVTMMNTEQGDLPVQKVLIELWVTFEDGSQGPVILPVVLNRESDTFGLGYDSSTQRRIDHFVRKLAISEISFHFLTTLDSSKTTNPVILALLSDMSSNEEIRTKLELAHALADEGKFLSQDDIIALLDYIMYF